MYSLEDSGAFVETREIEPAGRGSLDGLRFAAKDLIDIAGTVSGCGNPTWRATHPPAATNAICVDQLLLAGAACAGKTVTDELAFGLDGENFFHGTPLNPRAPQRVPGGSSSGSASAVACGLVEVALGTDTGGSVRIPANNCGINGLRPSHGRISLAGVMPFAPTFDTVGVLAADFEILDRTARVLLGYDAPREPRVGAVHLVSEAFESADEEVANALKHPVELVHKLYGDRVLTTSLSAFHPSHAEGLEDWYDAFHVVQWAEIWSTLGGWIRRHQPQFGPRTERNFKLAANLDRSRLSAAIPRREALFHALQRSLAPDHLLCMPTAPALAPLKGSLPVDRSSGGYYPRTVSFVSIAGIGRLPQITLPLAEIEGVPVGFSLLAAHGRDAFLLDVAREVTQSALRQD